MKKLLTFLLALTLSCGALSLAACGDSSADSSTGSGSGGSGSSAGSGAGSASGSGSGGSGDSAGTPAGGLTSDTDYEDLESDDDSVVTAKVWEDAFFEMSLTMNFSAKLTAGTESANFQVNGATAYLEIEPNKAYLSYANGAAYMYEYDDDSEAWEKDDSAGTLEEYFMYISVFRPNFADSFSSFEYDETKKAFVLAEAKSFELASFDEGVETTNYSAGELLVKIVEGNVALIEDKVTGITYTYYNYGATTVTLPSNVVEEQDRVEDSVNSGVNSGVSGSVSGKEDAGNSGTHKPGSKPDLNGDGDGIPDGTSGGKPDEK